MEADFRGFPDADDGKDIDSFLIRRARIALDGIFATYIDYRLMVDFAQKQSATNLQAVEIIQDAYANLHYWDAFQFEAGKFKQPIGFEQLIQDRYTPFIERSMFDQLLPGRDVGLMAHGEMLFSDRFDWAVALANGQFQNLDYDDNNKKDFTFRMLFRPFNGSWEVSWLKRLQFGIDATTGVEHDNFSQNAAGGTGFQLKTPATIPWLTFNNTAATATGTDVFEDGLRMRIAPSIAYFIGGLGMDAQVLQSA